MCVCVCVTYEPVCVCVRVRQKEREINNDGSVCVCELENISSLRMTQIFPAIVYVFACGSLSRVCHIQHVTMY